MSANVSKIDVVLNAAEARQEAAHVEQSMQGIAKSAQTAGVQASAGLSQVEAQIVRSSASTRQYTEAERQRTAAMREAAIASGNASLADAQRKAALFNEQVALKEATLAEKGKAMSAAETEAMAQRVAAAERARAVATQAAAAADTEAASASNLSVAQMLRAGGAIDKLALGVNTGARQLSVIATAFSAANAAQFGFLIGASLLIGELVKLASAKKEVIKIDSEYVALTAFAAQNGSLIVQGNNAQTVSAAALTGAIERVIVNQQKLNQENEKGAVYQEQLKTAMQTAQHEITVGTVGYGAALTVTKESAASYRAEIIKAADASQGFTKEVGEGLKGLDAYRAITHQGTDAVIEFARQQKYTNEQLEILRQALDEDVRKMGEFADQAAKAATHTRSLAEATIAFNIARATAQAPGFSNSQFATAADTIKFAQDIATNLQAATQQGATFREAVIGQSSALRELQQHLRETTLTVSGYKAEIGKLPEPTRNALVELEKIQKGMKVFADHTKQAESAAKALAIATSDLQAKLATAQAARGQASGDITSFDRQEADVKAAIALKRSELEQKKQLTEQNNILLRSIEATELATIGAKRAEAERLLAERLGQIEAAGYAKGSENKIAILRAELSKRYDAEADFVKKSGVSEQRQAEYLSFVRLALEAEYWGRREAIADAARKHELAEEQKLQEELINLDLKRFNEAMKHALDAQRAWNEARKFLFSQKQDASDPGIQRFIDQLKELGPAFQDVDKNSQTMRTAIDFVRHAFDFSSRSAEMFQLKLDVLTGHSVSFGQTFKAVFAEMFLNVQAATAFFEGFGQAIATVFEGLVTGTQNAKAAFLNFIATILAQMGSMAIAIGTIFLFIPGYGGLGAGLIAAGLAAMALSGVFRGLAQNAQKQSQQGAGTSNSTGSGANSGATNNGPVANVISFPTSGPLSGGPVTNVFKLDYQGTKDFLAGRVVTQEALNNPNSPEVRKIKKHARAS